MLHPQQAYTYTAIHLLRLFSSRAIQYSELGYIPEGYQETDRFTSEHLFNIIYTNENGEMITWDQMLVQDGGKLIADIEYDHQ